MTVADDKHLNGSADREREGDKKSAMNKLNDLTNSFCINGTFGFGGDVVLGGRSSRFKIFALDTEGLPNLAQNEGKSES